MHGRLFKTLRLSITDVCNLKCGYCVPNNALAVYDRPLPPEEIMYLVYLIKQVAGIEKVRITGGEPLISKNFLTIMRAVASFKFKSIGITTNATYLSGYLADIKKICPDTLLNVSLDTLDDKKFKSISGKSGVSNVLEALKQAAQMALPLKVNMVPRKGFNFEDIMPVLDFCIEYGITCRFIELMKMGHITPAQFNKEFVSLKEILSVISKKYSIKKMPAKKHATAVYYALEDFKNTKFGIIANESAPFCVDCCRLRLTSQGMLYGCLSNSNALSIKHLLKIPKKQAIISLQQILIQAMQHKQTLYFSGSSNVMKSLGG